MPPISCTSKWRIFSAALAGFAHHGKGLGQQIVQRRALGQALAELVGLGAQAVAGVVQLLELLGFQRVDLLDRAPVPSRFSRRSLRLPKIGSGAWATCGVRIERMTYRLQGGCSTN
jgi:hypothetical protein